MEGDKVFISRCLHIWSLGTQCGSSHLRFNLRLSSDYKE